MISLDAMVPAPASVAPPSVPTPVSVELTNTAFENNDYLKKQVATLQATVCHNEERIAILETILHVLVALYATMGPTMPSLFWVSANWSPIWRTESWRTP